MDYIWLKITFPSVACILPFRGSQYNHDEIASLSLQESHDASTLLVCDALRASVLNHSLVQQFAHSLVNEAVS